MACGLALGGCVFPVEGDPGSEPVEDTCSHQCERGQSTCHGSFTAVCEQDADGCWWWRPVRDCAPVGATCNDGACEFEETCPPEVDLFCRNDYLLACEGGEIVDFWACYDGMPCTEVVTESGRRAAACATGDEPCASKASATHECRGSDRVTCSYGLVTSLVPCGDAGCSYLETTLDEPVAICGP